MEFLESSRPLLKGSEPPEGASLCGEGVASVYIFGQEKRKRLAKWRERGRGPAYYKVVGSILYDVHDLQEFLQRSRVEPGAKRRRR